MPTTTEPGSDGFYDDLDHDAFCGICGLAMMLNGGSAEAVNVCRICAADPANEVAYYACGHCDRYLDCGCDSPFDD
jgi:hypothetical protein